MRERHFSHSLLKVAGVAIIAQFATACSSDILRFSDQPFGNPFRTRADTASTGAVNLPPKRINSASLPVPPAYQPLPGNVGATGQVAAAAAATQVAGSPVTGSVAGWTATGGSAVTIGAGDTIEALSNRYGVPASALRAANGIHSGQPSAGTRFVIPTYKPGASMAAAAEPTKVASTAPVQRAPRYEPLAAEPKKDAPKAAERKPRYEPVADKPKAEKSAKVSQPKVNQTKAAKPVEKAKVEAVKPVASEAPQKTAAKTVKKVVDEDDDDQPLPPKAPVKSAAKPAKVAAEPKAAAKPEARAESKTDVASTETTASASQDFRWPARGRVISGYGSKGPSGTNDGINIAVPEGTPVKAAEGGTVAYAGEEIKGYGKMVLIRHPNGYVSAYAHNGDLNVKRGDVVKRGQQIAKSGQSGNVTSPQLHFELRKGSDPVDPSKYLEN
jgi:murein DD-endopeptidase MepM/ murein hydrolase activator NlpD